MSGGTLRQRVPRFLPPTRFAPYLRNFQRAERKRSLISQYPVLPPVLETHIYNRTAFLSVFLFLESLRGAWAVSLMPASSASRAVFWVSVLLVYSSFETFSSPCSFLLLVPSVPSLAASDSGFLLVSLLPIFWSRAVRVPPLCSFGRLCFRILSRAFVILAHYCPVPSASPARLGSLVFAPFPRVPSLPSSVVLAPYSPHSTGCSQSSLRRLFCRPLFSSILLLATLCPPVCLPFFAPSNQFGPSRVPFALSCGIQFLSRPSARVGLPPPAPDSFAVLSGPPSVVPRRFSLVHHPPMLTCAAPPVSPPGPLASPAYIPLAPLSTPCCPCARRLSSSRRLLNAPLYFVLPVVPAHLPSLLLACPRLPRGPAVLLPGVALLFAPPVCVAIRPFFTFPVYRRRPL